MKRRAATLTGYVLGQLLMVFPRSLLSVIRQTVDTYF